MAEEEGVSSEAVSGPIRRVLFISAGASHSVALLCKLHFHFVCANITLSIRTR